MGFGPVVRLYLPSGEEMGRGGDETKDKREAARQEQANHDVYNVCITIPTTTNILPNRKVQSLNFINYTIFVDYHKFSFSFFYENYTGTHYH